MNAEVFAPVERQAPGRDALAPDELLTRLVMGGDTATVAHDSSLEHVGVHAG